MIMWETLLKKLLESKDPSFIIKEADSYILEPIIKAIKDKELSESIQLRVLRSTDIRLLRALSTCRNLSTNIFYDLLNYSDEEIFINLALNNYKSNDRVKSLCNTRDFRVVGILASLVDVELLRYIIKNFKNLFVYTKAATNPCITSELIKTLRKGFVDWDVNYALSTNPTIPEQIKLELVDLGDYSISIEIAKQKNLTSTIISKLLQEGSPEAKSTLINKNFEKLSYNQITTLMQDCSYEVISALAEKLTSSEDIILLFNTYWGPDINDLQYNKAYPDL